MSQPFAKWTGVEFTRRRRPIEGDDGWLEVAAEDGALWKRAPDHCRDMVTASSLTGWHVKGFVRPEAVIRTLVRAGIRFVMVGAYANAGWMRDPRASRGVDVLVSGRRFRGAINALRQSFPRLDVRARDTATGFTDPEKGRGFVRVISPFNLILRRAVRSTFEVRLGRQSYRIPGLEMALALKLAALADPGHCRVKKLLDAGDFMKMVIANRPINGRLLVALGELVSPGGGREISELVRETRLADCIAA